jgi:hypothetical protein
MAGNICCVLYMRINQRIYILLSIAYCFGCNNGSGKKGVEAYINNPANKLLQYQQVNDVTITMQYIPPTVKLKQLKARGIALQEGDSAEIFQYNDFRFELSKPLWKPDQQMMEYLQFKIGNDLVLVLKTGDTVRSSICERMANGSSSVHAYLVSFEKKDSLVNDLQFIYNDKVVDIGLVKFTIPGEQLKKTAEKTTL